MTRILTEWQFDQMACDCPFHRYHVMHLCLDHGKAISHSQADCDQHRDCRLLSCDPIDWQHGDTTQTFVDRLLAAGTFGPWCEELEGSYFERHWGE